MLRQLLERTDRAVRGFAEVVLTSRADAALKSIGAPGSTAIEKIADVADAMGSRHVAAKSEAVK